MKTRTMFLILLILIPTFPILQACGGGGGAWEGTVTDSAGIAVVHNTATPIWGAEDRWTVAEDLRIGSVAGEPEYQFGMIVFVEAAEDGTMYVIDVQAQELRSYGPDGSYLKTLATAGGGPGEIGQGAVWVLDDGHGTLVVPDLGNARVNRYNLAGEPLTSFPLTPQGGVPMRWGVDAGGRLVSQLRGMNVGGIAALEDGDPIVAYDTTGTVIDTVAMLPKGQMLAGITEEQFSMVLFEPEPIWDMDRQGSVFYASNDQYRIYVNGPDGTLSRIITRDVERKPVEESDKNAILRTVREQYGQFGLPAAQIEQLIQGIGFADFYPAFGLFFLGPEGTLWVQQIRSAKDMAEGQEEGFEFDAQDIGSPDWEVFDDQGRYLGLVTLPDRFQPTNVEGNHIYGIWRDELDVQYIMRLMVNSPA